jgi:hypothetical protein
MNEQYHFFSLIEPNYEAFTQYEIHIIDKNINDILNNHNKKYNNIVFDISNIGEEIPLSFQIISKPINLTIEDFKLIKKCPSFLDLENEEIYKEELKSFSELVATFDLKK